MRRLAYADLGLGVKNKPASHFVLRILPFRKISNVVWIFLKNKIRPFEADLFCLDEKITDGDLLWGA
ncbi:MAG: hypothetical protein U0V74_14620 [Chitinophagales bacterium]